MFLPAVDPVRQNVARGFTKNVFLGQAPNLEVHRRLEQELGDLVIEKRHAAFDRMRHLHAITEQRQDVARQRRLAPQIERLMDGRSPIEASPDVDAVEQQSRAVDALERREIVRVEERFERLDLAR